MKITFEVGEESVSCETDFKSSKSASLSENYEEQVKLFDKMFIACVRQMDRLTDGDRNDNAR